MATFSTDIFIKLATQIKDGKAIMPRRSDSDKEYFAQDWFEMSLKNQYKLTLQGRNSHPDFIVKKDELIEGAELKSLANMYPRQVNPLKNPCRTDVDFNSSIPCGLLPYEGKIMRTFYYFVLYEDVDRSTLTTKAVAMMVVDGNYLNRDIDLAKDHLNISESGFGSYGDGFIRTRKMYRFPNPLTEPDFRYKTLLITEEADLEKTNGDLELYEKKAKSAPTGESFNFFVYNLKGAISDKVVE